VGAKKKDIGTILARFVGRGSLICLFFSFLLSLYFDCLMNESLEWFAIAVKFVW